MRDFTENLESLGDIQGKYPQGTLVLRAQYVYMLQDQFRDLELDYRKISKMYVAEMEKAEKLENVNAEKDAKIIQLEALIENYNRISNEIIGNANNQKHKRCLAMARWCMARYNEWAAYYPTTTTRQMKFLDKWEKRWRKLADIFKGAE